MAKVFFRNNLAAVPRSEQPDHVRAMFRYIDRDGSGFLSCTDVIQGLRHVPELAGLLNLPQEVGDHELDAFDLLFSDMGRNDDAHISAYDFASFCLAIRDELIQPDQTLQTAESMFHMYDQDRSGFLTQNEIAAMLDVLGFVVDSAFVGQAMAHFGTYNFHYDTGIITLEQFPGLVQHLLSLQVPDHTQELDPEEELKNRRQARAARMQVRCDVTEAAKLSLQEEDDDDDDATVFDDGEYFHHGQVTEGSELQETLDASSAKPGPIGHLFGCDREFCWRNKLTSELERKMRCKTAAVRRRTRALQHPAHPRQLQGWLWRSHFTADGHR
jgi:Ca2+-binding EF-hand superfamily protein